MRQRVPEGSKLAAPPPRSQPPMEAEAENQQGAEEEGVRVPGEELRAPPPVEGARRPHRHQEALLPQARREEMEVRQVLQALRGAVRLQSPLQDLRHQGVPLRLWNRFLEVFFLFSLFICSKSPSGSSIALESTDRMLRSYLSLRFWLQLPYIA
ncbi:Zinc finger protein [Musa troglodytarum]|uniref:Zinc finger protein n=1 Tax=Musa troglodytarum TaxID=320322 RepID=A0A9E7H579_9LILI|nr:Zinc finger protein [Musa troglodytarum]